MRTIRILLTIFLLAPLPVFAQIVHIPDPNLRAAISEALDGAPVTRETMLQLTKLNARERGVTDLTGLGYAHNLRSLTLVYNNISDLTPIAGLHLDELWLWRNQVGDLSPLAGMRSLTHLDLGYNRISDLSPLANLTNLEWLELPGNQITDITTLSNLTQLTLLAVSHNHITDITPLSNLTQLEHLSFHPNLILDHSPLDGFASTVFPSHLEPCDMPPLPLIPRLQNRKFPSLVSQWDWPLVNKPHLSKVEQIAKHNLCFSCVGLENHIVWYTGNDWLVHGDLDAAIRKRDEYLVHNPHMIFMTVVNALWESFDVFPEDSPYWLRDNEGEIIRAREGVGVVNFNHPYVQKRIVDQTVATAKCGLFDGVIFDGWNPRRARRRGYISGMVATLKAIRERVSPDFLIAANTNRQIASEFSPYMNGFWLESGLPAWDVVDGEEGISRGFSELEASLSWAEQNARPPRINAFYGAGLNTADIPWDSPTNFRWMRAVTTLNLTFSDAYVFHGIEHAPYEYSFYWYDFWDADLGRPVGPKSQLYDEDIPGLYIREYTNGWAVYNHSGKPQIITLPEKAQGVASGWLNTQHALPNLDGEMYLRVKPKNPADVNGDSIVNILDLTLVAQAFGTDNRNADVNGDGVVNVFDLVVVANQF